MRSRVEAGGLEVATNFGKERRRLRRNRHASLRQRPIDVEHPEADAFHVKGVDRSRQRLALLNDGLELLVFWGRTRQRNQLLDSRTGARTMISSHVEN